MKRAGIKIQDIASYNNLAVAASMAAQGKRSRTDVKNFFNKFDRNLSELRNNILNGHVPCGRLNQFIIYDPKERIIHAPCFKDRVLHHAIMNFAGPVLDRAMVYSSFACRPGKGVHAAVRQVQKNIRRYLWYVKIDMKSYFDSIDHSLLLKTLKRRLKGNETLKLIARIIKNYCSIPGKGLPIGALPSQHFANYFLDGLDRHIMEKLHAKAHVRYMDDVIWWCESRDQAKTTLARVSEYVEDELLLEIKKPVVQVNRSNKGVAYCGFRILPGTVKLSRRRCKRYNAMRRKWEGFYKADIIDGRKLQSAYASVHAITDHADSREWRKKQLRIYSSVDC